MAKTLEELKAENARLEQENAQAPQAAPDQPEPAVDQPDDDPQAANPDDQPEGGEAEAESWMESDGQESQGAEKKFTDKDIGAAKAKLRAKLDREHQSELEKLQQQLEEERRKNQQAPQVGDKPKLEQFYDHDSPEEAFAEALVEWKLKSGAAQQQASQQQYEQKRRELEAQQRTESALDQHYERAAKLSEASGIAPELYQSADLNVRQAIETVFPGGGGERITNSLIAILGEGSEKVFYNLGVNQARRSELVRLLKEDPNGLLASVYLGKLSEQLNAPTKRTSNAPAPAAQARGDANTTVNGQALHKKYNEAHRSGDVSAAFKLKREAKAAGVDTKSW